MSLLNRRRIFVLAGMLICAVPQIAPAQNPDEDAKAAIREVIEKFNSAYKQENGPDIIGEVLSDKAFTYARTAGEGPARILSKAAYVDAFKKYLWKKTPKKHEHRVDGLTVIGGMAYEFGTIIDVTEDGFDTQSEVFNVFAREEGGWKLVFSSVPDFFKGRGGSAAADEEAVR